MSTPLFEKLQSEGLISDASLEKIKAGQSSRLFSLHWELKTILYLGVLLLSGGLGILIYKNIDSISHQVILLFIALVCAGSFFYCFKKKLPFSMDRVAAPNSFFDYILLLGCLTFITFIGYLQYQYHFFGDRFGLVTFIPMVVLFLVAYFFDHLGILSMAITNLAAWAGIAVTPARILKDNDFNNTTITITGVVLGILLIVAGIVTEKRKVKPHFEFTYTNFGTHLLFISCLAGLFYFEAIYLLWFLFLAGIAWYFYMKAMREKSFYFLLILTIYTYIGLSCVVLRLLFSMRFNDIGGVYLAFLYFIGSAVGLILFLVFTNRKLKR